MLLLLNLKSFIRLCNWLLFSLKSPTRDLNVLLEVLLILEILLILLLIIVLIILLIIINIFLHIVTRVVLVLVLKLLGRRRLIYVLSSEIFCVLINWLMLNVCLGLIKLFLLCLLTWKFTHWISLLLAYLALDLVFKVVGRLILILMSLSHVIVSLVVSVSKIILLLKVILLLTWMGSVIISKLCVVLLLRIIIKVLILLAGIISIAVWSVWTANHADIIGLKWLKLLIFCPIVWSCTIRYYNRLIHDILVIYLIIESFYILQIFNLASKKSQVIRKHFPIKFFTNILFLFIIFIFLFPSIVNIAIKKNKLMPVF